jgi:hypothetical protein
MKKIILVLQFLIACNVNLFPQWSTDPNNNLIVGYGLDPHICSDSAGGCYITYDYENINYPRKLAIERLDKYGNKPWGSLKQIIGESPQQYRAKIIEDGEGGAIISCIDRYENLPIWTQRVIVQKVDSTGNFLWGQTGIKVTLNTINQGDHHLATDGNGGCVIAWQDVNYTYFINRIDRDGNRLLGDNGITLNTGGSNAQPIIVKAADGNYYLQAGTIIYRINQNGDILNQFSSTILGQPVPDPEGGVVVSGSIGNIFNRKLVSQRKDSLGNDLWQEPYVEIADSLYINSPIYVREINGYYYYYWWGFKNGIQLVAQYQILRSEGTKLFNQGSIPISDYPVDALFGNILASDSATYLLIWQDYRQEDGVFGQKKDSLNNKLWNSDDVPLYTGLYSELHAITDCAGGVIGLGWHQFDFTLRTFKVSKNGILGEVITNIDHEYQKTFPEELILYQNFPNPYNSSTTIQFHLLTESKISIDLYNVLGEKIQTIANGVYPQGINSILFSSDNLPSGIYLYKMQTETRSLTKKLIIIK